MITINRDVLLRSLILFSQEDSGLVVGNPGIGKSYLLEQLKNHFLDNGIVCFVIKIDALPDASDLSIQAALNIREPWIETFKRIKLKEDQKAVLVFDAFDAARNDTFRKEVIEQIKKVKEALHSKWNVIASVRTYDAAKSQQLIEVFKNNEEFTDYINCRKFIIPSLNETEILTGIAENKRLELFYEQSNQNLKDILKTPFFLKIADAILIGANENEIEEVKQFKSESQLLKRFWNLKIKGDYSSLENERILTIVANEMVNNRTLNVSKIFLTETISQNATGNLQHLLREHILEEVSVYGSRIAFSHNILFDYTVSALLLSTNMTKLLDFMLTDPSRPFFLRPSFIYFFTEAWYTERSIYWRLFWNFFEKKEKELRLFVRLVLTGIIASEFSNLDELQPIIDTSDLQNEEIIRNILQSLQFIRSRTKKQDIKLLNFLSENLRPIYVWQFSFLLERAINEDKLGDEYKNACGKAARNFLAYVLNQRTSDDMQALDRLGATRGIELVCKTYKTDIQKSKLILRSILSLLEESNFDIYYFSTLAQNVKEIITSDASFASEIYLALFNHEENRGKETTLGSSILMTFRSNRRQDFEMSYYYLVESFPYFLANATETAIRTGLIVTKLHVLKDQQQYGRNPATVKLSFKSFDCIYISDNSIYWSDNTHYHKPTKLASLIIDYFKDQQHNGKLEGLEKLFDVYIQNATVGYTWSLLIKFGCTAVINFTNYFFDFCVEEQFYIRNEVNYDIRELIEIGSSYFTSEQIRKIEETIFNVAAKNKDEISERFLQNYLSRIPIYKIQHAKSIQILEEKGVVPNQKPFYSSTTSGIYTTTQWLEDSGVNTSDPLITELLEGEDSLRPFTNEWLNGEPPQNVAKPFLKKAIALFIKIKEVYAIVDERVMLSVLREIAQTFTAALRNESLLFEPEYELLKEGILYCYYFSTTSEKDENSDSSASGIHSPTPKTVASEALIFLVVKENTEELIQTLLDAVNHSYSIIRLHSSSRLIKLKSLRPELYWDIIIKRLANEKDALVAYNIIGNARFNKTEGEKINEILDVAYSNERLFTWQNAFVESFIHFAINQWVFSKNKHADYILERAFEREVFYRYVIFEGFKKFRAISYEENEIRDFYVKSVIRWTNTYVNEAFKIISDLSKEEFNSDNSNVKSFLSLIELIIQRCYYVLGYEGNHNRDFFEIPKKNHQALYFLIKPVFEKVVFLSSQVVDGGLIIGITAHYFIETLNACLEYEPANILSLINQITNLAIRSGYTYDSLAIREMVMLSEKLLADHRELLTETESFDQLINLLDIYTQSGWTEALELLWKLDEIFK